MTKRKERRIASTAPPPRLPSEILQEYLYGLTDRPAVNVCNVATGLGKTFNVFDFIVNVGMRHYPYCVYIVPQRKQRDNAEKELKANLSIYGATEKDCLVLTSTIDRIYLSYDRKHYESLSTELTELCNRPDTELTTRMYCGECQETIRKVTQLVSAIRQNEVYRTDVTTALSESELITADKELRDKLRRILRSLPGLHLNDDPKDTEGLQCNISQSSRILPTITLLYPWLDIYRKKVIICTATKYLQPLDMVVNPPVNLTTWQALKNSLLVVDESDAVYQDWLKTLIAQPSGRSIKRIYSQLTELYTMLASAGENIPTRHPCRQELTDIISKVTTACAELMGNTGLDKHSKIMVHRSMEKQRYCVFHTAEARYVCSDKSRGLRIVQDRESNHHEITAVPVPLHSSDTGDENSGNIPPDDVYVFSTKAIGIMEYAAREISRAAVKLFEEELQRNRDILCGKRKGEYRPASVETALGNILHYLNITGHAGGKDITATLRHLGNLSAYQQNIPPFAADYTHYNRGWQLVNILMDKTIALEDHYASDFTSLAERMTPEKIIMHLSKRLNMTVVLLSATAASRSLSTNFNISYLRHMLAADFRMMPTDVVRRIEEAMNRYLPDKKERPVVCTAMVGTVSGPAGPDGSDLVPTHAAELFPPGMQTCGRDFFKSLANVLQQHFSNKSAPENRKSVQLYVDRYHKLLKAYKEFSEDPDLTSCLCLGSRLPGSAIEWNLDLLEQGAALIDGRIGLPNGYRFGQLPDDLERRLYGVNTANYTTALSRVQRLWGQGKKALIVSTYQTLGAGMNLDYHTKDTDAVTGRALPYRHPAADGSVSKDVDGIILMDIRNYRPYNRYNRAESQEVKAEELSRYIAHLLAMQYSGKIAHLRVRQEIAHILSSGRSSFSDRNPDLKYDMLDYQLYLVTQAMGRISRTTLKGRKTRIWYDSSLEESIARADMTESHTYEFRQLHAHAAACRENDRQRLQAAATRMYIYKSNTVRNREVKLKSAALAYYHHPVGEVRDYTAGVQEYLARLHECFMKYPTLQEHPQDDVPEGLLWHYLHAPEPIDRYHVTFEEGSDMVVNGLNLTRTDVHNVCVEEAATHLDKLMRNDICRRYFERKGYATGLKPGCYILPPYQMLSTYKGCIGEACFKAIMETVCPDICLKRFGGTLYEIADFYVEGLALMFDVKNYQPYNPCYLTQRDRLVNIRHKQKKAQRRLVVINMLSSEEHPYKDVQEAVYINGLIDAATGRLIMENIEELKRIINYSKNEN